MSIPIPGERQVEHFDLCVRWLAQRLPGLEDDLKDWSQLFKNEVVKAVQEEASG